MTLFAFWLSHRAEFAAMLGQHIALVLVATMASIAIGLPVGIFAARRPRLGAPIVAAANIVQTIPSLAMFGFLIPLPLIGGVGARTAAVVLILYGLLPIVRGAVAGLRGIDPAVREAGTALGMTPRQLLWRVELPLAAPAIVAGIRVATVVGVGTATIAAAIGAGGLGEYIFRGLSMVDPTVILAGAVPAALLAVAADLALGWLERRLVPGPQAARRRAPIVVGAALLALALGAATVAASRRGDAVRVGSKNFTEQLILGELVAQTIEREAGLRVERRLNLGGTFICDRALRGGEIDAYVEYTGTALTAIFHEPVTGDRAAAVARTRELYARSGRTQLEPLGFNNTFAILVRGQDARTLGLRTISDLTRQAPRWRAGFGYEFLERADGFKGLARTYGLHFAIPPRVMDMALMYRALAARQVDVIAGDSTNGLIERLDLFMLEDDRSYFPPYDAVPLVRAQVLLRHPAIRPALQRLAGRITERDMRRLNHAVDGEKRDMAEVVREFLSR
jgi:osmoprotectant transport system permease protein